MSDQPHAKASRFTRAPEHDRRIRRGDDFAGDAWVDRVTGAVRYVAVGVEPDDRKDAPPAAYLYRKAGHNDTVGLVPNGAGAELGWEVIPLVPLAEYAPSSPDEDARPTPAAYLYRKAGYNDTVGLVPNGVGAELGWEVIPLIVSPTYALTPSADAPPSASQPKPSL